MKRASVVALLLAAGCSTHQPAAVTASSPAPSSIASSVPAGQFITTATVPGVVYRSDGGGFIATSNDQGYTLHLDTGEPLGWFPQGGTHPVTEPGQAVLTSAGVVVVSNSTPSDSHSQRIVALEELRTGKQVWAVKDARLVGANGLYVMTRPEGSGADPHQLDLRDMVPEMCCTPSRRSPPESSPSP